MTTQEEANMHDENDGFIEEDRGVLRIGYGEG